MSSFFLLKFFGRTVRFSMITIKSNRATETEGLLSTINNSVCRIYCVVMKHIGRFILKQFDYSLSISMRDYHAIEISSS